MYRDRRQNIRRVFEVGEIMPTEHGVKENILYTWQPESDTLKPEKPSTRLIKNIKTYTNMSDREIERDLAGKQDVLEWMLARNINGVEEVGGIISDYYADKDEVLARVKKK
jgi:hypothetical protein